MGPEEEGEVSRVTDAYYHFVVIHDAILKLSDVIIQTVLAIDSLADSWWLIVPLAQSEVKSDWRTGMRGKKSKSSVDF